MVTLGWGMGSASESNEAKITKPRYKDCINQKPKQQACLNKMDISSRLFGPQVNLIWRQACLSVRSLGNTFVVAGYIYIYIICNQGLVATLRYL